MTNGLPKWAVYDGDVQATIAMENLLAMGDQPVEDRTNWLANFITRALADAAKPKWQSIETAPKDTVVLTDCGTAMHYDGQWFLCTAGGVIPSCADWGREVSQISPSVWATLPAAPEVG